MMDGGVCGACGYGPVPVYSGEATDVKLDIVHPSGRDVSELCAICLNTHMHRLHVEGLGSLAKVLAQIANAAVDAHGIGYRILFDGRLRGESDPGGTYSAD